MRISSTPVTVMVPVASRDLSPTFKLSMKLDLLQFLKAVPTSCSYMIGSSEPDPRQDQVVRS